MEIMNLIWGLEADTYSSFEANTSPFQHLPGKDNGLEVKVALVAEE